MEIVFVFSILLIGLLLAGVPVGFSIGITSVVALIIKNGLPDLSFGLIAQMLTSGINNFPIVAVPLFLLAGAIINHGGMSKRIFDFASCIVGPIRGGLAHVNVLASFIFSGISGAAAADVAGLGQIEIRAMTRAGFDKNFSCAVTAASATIGPIVPPSIPLVLYGVLAGTSVSKLFIGGIVPGILLVISLIIMNVFISRLRRFPKGEHFDSRKLVQSFKNASLPLLLPVMIVGGIWSGVFTPTEAAAVAVVFSLFLGVVVYREIRVKQFWEILQETAKTSAAILFILASAMIYNCALTRTHVPAIVTDLLFSFNSSPFVLLILLNIVLFITGCFMSTAAAISLFTPLFAPLLMKFGVDPLHFGVVMVLNLMLGQITPPFGIVLYVLTSIADVSFNELVKACIPFYIPIIVVLILIVVFPVLVTSLPNWVFG
ncbi:MAG: TRAP transporter large permease [Planctomycetota bacterium]|jgi:tripartite ATP-independent transporter DctM subunit